MGGSSWSAFAKTVVIPMLIALGIYVVAFLVLLPLYRRYRSNIARYSSYTPLSSSLAQQTTSLFEPYLIDPSKTLVQKLREAIVKGIRWALLPRARAWDTTASRGQVRHGQDRDEDEEDEGGLFDAESGEAMVGFDFQQSERGHGRVRQMEVGGVPSDGQANVDDSNRRLSRELEEGFRDDSGDEASDEEVTAGRRTVSRRASEVWR